MHTLVLVVELPDLLLRQLLEGPHHAVPGVVEQHIHIILCQSFPAGFPDLLRVHQIQWHDSHARQTGQLAGFLRISLGILSEYTMDTLASGYQKYPVTPEIAFNIGIFANDLDDLTPAANEFVRLITQEMA